MITCVSAHRGNATWQTSAANIGMTVTKEDEANKSSSTQLGTRHRTLLQKIVETGFCVATWLALGLYLEIFGPTLVDLKIKLHTDYEKVAGAVSGRPVGLFPGCLLGGLLVDKLGTYCHLMIALCLDVGAIVTVIIPWCSNVDVVWFLCFIGGLVESIINVAGQRIILNIWQEQSAGPLHLLHMGYGIGSFIIPLYTNPFLAIERKDDVNSMVNGSAINSTDFDPANNNVNNFMNTSAITSTHFETTSNWVIALDDNKTSVGGTSETIYERESRIEYPYAISAGLVALLSVAFFIYQVLENRTLSKIKKEMSKNAVEMNGYENSKNVENPEPKVRSFKQMINPATCTGGRFSYGIQIFFLVFLYFGNTGGGERVIAGFLRSYAVDQLGFTTSNASYINTAFWISFTLGRLCFFGLAKFISIRIIIMIETIAITVISILMNLFATQYSLAYWLLLQPLGFFLAPLWPSGVGWSDFHVELTGLAMALILLGGSVGGICHLRIIGYLYEHIGPRTFLYQVQVYAVLALILASCLNFLGYRNGSRFDVKKEKEENVD